MNLSATARSLTILVTLLVTELGVAQEIAREDTYILVAGRRLPYLYAISLEQALDPANQNSPNAIISRSKVALDHLDGRSLGDPANLIVSEDGRTVYVVNHHGSIDNTEFSQHGGRGLIAVMDVDAVLDPDNDLTANALRQHIDSGGFGALGVALLPDLLVISNAENNLTEDGGNRVTFVDRRTGSLRNTVELALGEPGFSCPEYPVPFVSPHGPPDGLAVLSRDPSFGCFPNPNGLALGWTENGQRFVFTANGGTDDISVIDLQLALNGESTAEISRIPAQVGPWGMTATPDGRHIIVSNGGSQRSARSGNSLSIIDVALVAASDNQAEVARVLVGTDDPTEQSHPFITSVTPDGNEIIVPNYRMDSVSIVNLDLALSGSDSEVARIRLTRSDGNSVRPKGSAITSDGRYAVISAGAGSRPYSQETGHVYIIDLESRNVIGTVTGVGNDPYGLALIYRE